MAVLVDTNVLVYRHDPRDPRKQKIATDLLRKGVADDSIRVAYQAVVEFYAAAPRRPISSPGPTRKCGRTPKPTEFESWSPRIFSTTVSTAACAQLIRSARDVGQSMRLFVSGLLLLASSALAAPTEIKILVDSDKNVSTGCRVFTAPAGRSPARLVA